jgi:hypothetical protein
MILQQVSESAGIRDAQLTRATVSFKRTAYIKEHGL